MVAHRFFHPDVKPGRKEVLNFTTRTSGRTTYQLCSNHPLKYCVGGSLDEPRKRRARHHALISGLTQSPTAFPHARLSHEDSGVIFEYPCRVWRKEQYAEMVELVIQAFALEFEDDPVAGSRAFRIHHSLRKLRWEFDASENIEQLARLIRQVPGVDTVEPAVGGGIEVWLRPTWKHRTSADRVVRGIMAAYIAGSGDGMWD
jgi:hypothetical protein